MFRRAVPSPTAWRGLGRLETGCSSAPATCMRSFSTSPRYNFREICHETENTELNAIIKQIQETIILPAYLPPKQRRIVFDPKKRSYLEQNPIDIEVDGLEYRFKSIDKAQDIPNTRPILWQAIGAMKTKQDWDNLGTLLAGYQKANINISREQEGKLTRLILGAGQIDTLVEIVKQARQTGFYIQTKEQMARIYLALNDRIESANGDLDQIRHAVKVGEAIINLVQQPEAFEKTDAQGRKTTTFLHFSPVVRTNLLRARVALAKAKQQAEEPIEEDLVIIKDELALLKSLWEPYMEDGLLQASQSELRNLSPTESRGPQTTRLSGTDFMRALAYVVRGIESAEELAREETAPLKPLIGLIDQLARETTQARADKAEVWTKEYESIRGQE